MSRGRRGEDDEGGRPIATEVVGSGGEHLVLVHRFTEKRTEEQKKRYWLEMPGDEARNGLLHHQYTHISNFGIVSKPLPSITFRGGWFDLHCLYSHLPFAVRLLLAQMWGYLHFEPVSPLLLSEDGTYPLMSCFCMDRRKDPCMNHLELGLRSQFDLMIPEQVVYDPYVRSPFLDRFVVGRSRLFVDLCVIFLYGSST